MKRPLIVSTLAVALTLSTGFAFAEEQKSAQENIQSQAQEQVYGSELMTEQERTEYSDKMHAATTDEEREQIRKEHHEHMKELAKTEGVTMPDDLPASGAGIESGDADSAE